MAQPIRITQADVVISRAEKIPPDDAAWRRVDLPHRASKPDGDDLVWYWYRAGFDLNVDPVGIWLLFPKLRSGGAIYINGTEIGAIRSADADYQVRWFRPRLVFVPTASLRRGHNEIAVHFPIREPLTSFGEIEVGHEDQLRPRYEELLFWEDTSTTIASLLCLIFGGLNLAFWLRRRQETLYGILAGSALFWGIRTFVFRIPIVPMDAWVLWRTVYYLTTGGFIVFITMFILGFSQRPAQRFVHSLMAYWIVGSVGFLAVGWPARAFMDNWWTLGFLPFTVYAIFCLVRFAVKTRTTASLGMLFAILVALALALHDYAVQRGVPWLSEFYLLHLGVPVFLLVMAGVLLDRFVDSLRRADRAAEELTARVATREAELAHSYARLRELERAQATSEERRRIMQDMHDGVGSQLLSTLLLVERGAASRDDMVALLRECLDDMRLVIDSLSPEVPDLLPVFGSLRFRMEPRLAAMGLVSRWIFGTLPESLVLAPHDALQILRIVQEALTNVVKHARAQQVTVHLNCVAGILTVLIADDGVGFDPAGHSAGRGLLNMRSRATRIGADLRLMQGMPGTIVSLTFDTRHSTVRDD